jgi:hypothetical protein
MAQPQHIGTDDLERHVIHNINQFVWQRLRLAGFSSMGRKLQATTPEAILSRRHRRRAA